MSNRRRKSLPIISDSFTEGKGWFMPRWTCKHATYHVGFRLADSLPQQARERLQEERSSLLKRVHSEKPVLTIEERRRLQHLLSEKTDHLLNVGYGACYLAIPEIADIVKGALEYSERDRYVLHTWCIMPNHVHVIVEPRSGQKLSSIVQRWKSYTAHAANKHLNRQGTFWMNDFYNRIIRDEREYGYQMRYVWENAEHIGEYDWPWRWIKPEYRDDEN